MNNLYDNECHLGNNARQFVYRRQLWLSLFNSILNQYRIPKQCIGYSLDVYIETILYSLWFFHRIMCLRPAFKNALWAHQFCEMVPCIVARWLSHTLRNTFKSDAIFHRVYSIQFAFWLWYNNLMDICASGATGYTLHMPCHGLYEPLWLWLHF